jgi:hypothetical protein
MPWMRVARLAALAGMMPITTATLPAVAQVRPDTVRLVFDWPVGTYAHVDQEWSRVQAVSARRDSLHVRSTHRLQLLPHSRGRLVRADSFRLVSVGGNAVRGAVAAEGRDVLARIGSFQPSYVVSAQGEFVGVEDLDRMKAVLDSLLAPVLGRLGAMPPEARALVDNVMSPAALNNAAQQEWNLLAGAWVGAIWEIGETYGLRTEEPYPLMPNLRIPMDYEFSAAARVPCREVETSPRCVRFEMLSVADTAGLRKVLTEFLGVMAPKEREAFAAMQGMRAETALTIIADPRNLRPYSVRLVKRVETSLGPGSNQAQGPGTRIDTRLATFRYVR